MRLIRPNIRYFYKIWGGERLAKMKNALSRNENQEMLGEVWEVSQIPEGPTVSQEDPLNYVFKLIDTSDFLSVQVHPNDEYAQETMGTKGKTECWVILETSSKACLYLGFQAGVTKSIFQKAVAENQDLSKLLVKYNVAKGDVFVVPAGAVHAIGPGVTLAEVQQASGITYRVWDWDRLDHQGKSRELHLKEAFDVLNFGLEFQKSLQTMHFKNLFSLEKTKIYQHPDFTMWYQSIEEKQTVKFLSDQWMSLYLIDGEVSVKAENEEQVLRPGETLVIKEPSKNFELNPISKGSKCLFIN